MLTQGTTETSGRQARLCVMAALLATVLAWASGADAAEWSIGPFVSVAGDYDDNAGLQSRTDAEEKISGFIGEFGADVGYRSDLSNLRVIPRIVSRRYPGDSDFDNDDQFLNYRFTRQMRNGNWGISGRFIRDYIRTGERAYVNFEADDPEELEDDDSGRVGARDRRLRWSATPRLQTRLSEQSYLDARVRYSKTDYDQTLETRLVDFETARAEARYNRIIDSRTTGIVELDGLWYSAEGTPGDSTSYGLQLGVRRDLSETTNFEVLGGLSTSERVQGGNETNWIGEANIVRRLETIRLTGQYRRSISGTGSGTLTRRDQVNVAFTRRLTNLFTAGLGFLAYTTNSVEDVEFDERDYAQLRAQFTWKLTRTFDLETNYRWTLINREDDDGTGTSNGVTVWLHYRPNAFSVSR